MITPPIKEKGISRSIFIVMVLVIGVLLLGYWMLAHDVDSALKTSKIEKPVPTSIPTETTITPTSTKASTVASSSDRELVLEYHFDGDAKDSSGNGRNGIIRGATFVDGVRGKALSFNGENDHVEVPAFTTPNKLTIEFWIYFISITSGPYQIENLVGNRESDSNFDAMVYRVETQRLRPHVSATGGQNFDSKTILQAGVWYHIVETWERPNLRLFVNGVEDGNSPMVSRADILGLTNRWFIGKDSKERAPHAIIDEVRIYNKALSAYEIKQHYEEL